MADVMVKVRGEEIALQLTPSIIDGLHALSKQSCASSIDAVVERIADQKPDDLSRAVHDRVLEFFRDNSETIIREA